MVEDCALGTDIECIIEYISDEGSTSFQTSGLVLSLDEYVDLVVRANYRFIGAISGVRADSDRAPLIPLRGLPEDLSIDARNIVDELYDPSLKAGWLRLNEIESSLEHLGISRQELNLPTRVLLELMGFLVKTLENDRVRLIFIIS